MRVFYLSFFVVLIDQITKILIKGISIPSLGIKIDGMRYAQSFNVFGDFFKITFVENPGMAFGMDFGPTSKFFLSLFSIIASIGLIYYIYKVRNEKLVLRIALAFILGGAFGNLIDRVFYGVIYDYAPLMYGKVVDFLDVDFFNFTLFGHTYDRWPIFNIADSAVTIGVILLILFNNGSAKVQEEELEELDVDPLGNGSVSNLKIEKVDGKNYNREDI